MYFGLQVLVVSTLFLLLVSTCYPRGEPLSNLRYSNGYKVGKTGCFIGKKLVLTFTCIRSSVLMMKVYKNYIKLYMSPINMFKIIGNLTNL